MPFVAQVQVNDVASHVADLALCQKDIKALDRRTDLVGKHFKSTKSKTTWSFNVKMSCYTVELLTSNLSGKKRVKVNGKFVESAKSDPMAKQQSDPSVMQESDMTFSADGIKFEITLNSKKRDLLINGHLFSDLNEQRISKITSMLASSKQLRTNNSKGIRRNATARTPRYVCGFHRTSLRHTWRWVQDARVPSNTQDQSSAI